MSEYWNIKAETMSQDEIESCQLSQLKQVLIHVYDNNAFYKTKMDAVGFKPGD